MKLITWNCQGAFRKKAEFILSLQPDILIVQECECLDKLKFNATIRKPNDVYWHGDGGVKGIGIFSYSEYKFKPLPEFNSEFRYIIPLHVIGGNEQFLLFAIWAMNNKENYEASYIGQIWRAINYYDNLIGDSTILAGDFNSNKIWDKKPRVGTHSDVVNMLANKGIHSIYHDFFSSEQGNERHPTLYMYRKKEKPYHIDYCFVSKNLLNKVNNVSIGIYEDWIIHSDHSPLSVEFNL